MMNNAHGGQPPQGGVLVAPPAILEAGERIRHLLMCEGGRAYPAKYQEGPLAGYHPGPSLKAKFAGDFMARLLTTKSNLDPTALEEMAGTSIKAANALLAALQKDAERERAEAGKGGAT